MHFFSFLFLPELPRENSYKDTLCREIIMQSLKISNDEEAVL